MSNIWDKTLEINPSMVRDLLFSEFSLSVQTIEPLGEGFDNSAFLINGRFVFRFPHRPDALACMANEITLLPYFVQHLSFSLPKLAFIGQPTLNYPFPFAGYKILKGSSLSKYQNSLVDNLEFATTLATWLKELHTLPVLEKHKNLIQGKQDWRLDVANRTERVIESVTQYEKHFTKVGFNSNELIKYMAHFHHLDTTEPKRCYVHGDLYAKHILVNEQGLPAALIDWGDVHIGHPAIDLSMGMMIFNQAALTQFLDTYGDYTKNTFDIALFRAFNHAVISFPYFCEIGETAWTKAAITNAIRLIEENK